MAFKRSISYDPTTGELIRYTYCIHIHHKIEQTELNRGRLDSGTELFQASDVVYAWNIMVTPVGGKMSTENTESTEDICCPALYEN